MKLLKFCLPLFILQAVLSCSTEPNEFDPASYLGTKVVFPEEIDNISDAPSRIFVYLDLLTCPSCELKSLHFWEEDLKQFNQLNGDSHCLDIIVIVNAEHNKEANAALADLQAYFPIKIFYDSQEEFVAGFTPPAESQYRCFLLDKSNRIKLLGYPYMNKELKEKYISRIFHRTP